MKVSELERLLGNYNGDADVFFEDAEGVTHEIAVRHRDAVFDGFDEAYDEGPNIIMTD